MSGPRRLLAVALAAWAVTAWGWRPAAAPILPNKAGTLKMAVIGDNGTGKAPQYEVASQMALQHRAFPFDLVLMCGDNFYGSQRAGDLVKKFDTPYKPLLGAGVIFQAVLGNHDEPSIVSYPPLNMGGARYYTFARQQVRFVALDTNELDAPQLAWAERTLAAATEPWKIVFFHHPLYSNAGRHGPNREIALRLEPMLVQYGVSVVFAGHDHVYERLHPQRGVTHFVVGSSGQLRSGDLRIGGTTAAGFDSDRAFLLIEIDADRLHFQAVSRTGVTVDSGDLPRRSPASGT